MPQLASILPHLSDLCCFWKGREWKITDDVTVWGKVEGWWLSGRAWALCHTLYLFKKSIKPDYCLNCNFVSTVFTQPDLFFFLLVTFWWHEGFFCHVLPQSVTSDILHLLCCSHFNLARKLWLIGAVNLTFSCQSKIWTSLIVFW